MEDRYTFGFLQFKKKTCTVSRVPFKEKVVIPSQETADMTSRNDGYFLLRVQNVSKNGILTCVPESPIWPATQMSQAIFHLAADKMNGLQLMDFASRPKGFAKLLSVVFTAILQEKGSTKNPDSIYVWRIIRHCRFRCTDFEKAQDVIIRAILKNDMIFSKMVRAAFTVVEPSPRFSRLMPKGLEIADGEKSSFCVELVDVANRDAFSNVCICDESDMEEWEESLPPCMRISVHGPDFIMEIDPQKAEILNVDGTPASGVTAILKPFSDSDVTMTVTFQGEKARDVLGMK